MSSTSTKTRLDTTSTTYDKSIHLTESEKQILDQFVAWLYDEAPQPDSMSRERLMQTFYAWRTDWWTTQTGPT